MKPALIIVAVLALFPWGQAQDLRVREEAVRLLERANLVSTAPKLPNLERTDNFRVFTSNGGVREGTFSRLVIQGTGRRDDYHYGDYKLASVWTHKQVAAAGGARIMPPDIVTMMRITPIYLVRFDDEDVIRQIIDRNVSGRAAHCIEFDTIAGETSHGNELCVDAANGTLIYEKLKNEVVENSEWFRFAGALMPGKISYSFAGVPKMEIVQSLAPLSDTTPDVLAAPLNAQVHTFCRQFRRAFGLSMPQPKPGNGGMNTDVVVRGVIGLEGRVVDAVVEQSDRPDLNPEAVSLVKQWVFTPAMCDGHPNANEADFVLHFRGR